MTAADNTPRKLPKGSRVLITRDENKYPARGTWFGYRGKKGFVTEHNLGEIGVAFSKGGSTEAWFQPYEVERIK